MKALKLPPKRGKLVIAGYSFQWDLKRVAVPPTVKRSVRPLKLHFGPGPGWTKPDDDWLAVDVDPERADLVVDFGEFKRLPLESGSVSAIYGSHVFEHISLYVTPKLFKECYRVLQAGGRMRMVLPDVERSIKAYLAGDAEFPLFAGRRARA
jgi:predicted SAM-dependent methyltransferase